MSTPWIFSITFIENKQGFSSGMKNSRQARSLRTGRGVRAGLHKRPDRARPMERKHDPSQSDSPTGPILVVPAPKGAKTKSMNIRNDLNVACGPTAEAQQLKDEKTKQNQEQTQEIKGEVDMDHPTSLVILLSRE
ncbi:hypothetical protein L484_018631 [Morus notabilis]|uniref:Uncharacterized protein n=1 Tax=Morus notabilis TaxID=981085 RepID=W9RHQ4_9ROSA|nr:hypothetical protein L484_018631 [Morus notabilis]